MTFRILTSKTTTADSYTFNARNIGTTSALLLPEDERITSLGGAGLTLKNTAPTLQILGDITAFTTAMVLGGEDSNAQSVSIAPTAQITSEDVGIDTIAEATLLQNAGWLQSVSIGIRGLESDLWLKNTGAIQSLLGTAVLSLIGDSTIHNSRDGLITGLGGIGMEGGTTEITNFGEIVGEGFAIRLLDDDAEARVENMGQITGDVLVEDAARMTLINGGTILGDVSFGSGADVFDGRDGTVTGKITGGAGGDWFDLRGATVGQVAGGRGSDVYVVNDASIEITEAAKGGIDLVRSAVTFSLGDAANVENLVLIGARDTRGFGSDGKNILVGNAGDNRLVGYGGEDQLIGGTGDDTLRGGAAADQLEGGVGDDILRGGEGADLLIGQDGDDLLVGGAGTDTMRGGDGDDTLLGSPGRDDMTGGDGADVFRFTSVRDIGTAPNARPQIRDFATDIDLIDLTAIQADLGAVNFDPGFIFLGNDVPFTGFQAGELRVDTLAIPGRTLIEGDMNLDGQRDFVIEVSGTIPFEPQFFIL